MLPAFNRGVWKNMEDATKMHMFLNPGTYRITVTMTYADPATSVPTAFTVTREVQAAKGGWTEALPTVVLSQPDDIEETAPLSLTDQLTVTGKSPIKTIGHMIFVGGDFDTGKLTFTAYVNTKGHMPPTRKSHYPDAPAKRPYELLDILSLNGTIKLPYGPMAFGTFSGVQRTLIIQTNKARNGGRLKSDDPHDPQQDLDERGAANAPEVDHIVPKSRGGSNHYSNARLVSWQLNNRDDRVKSLKGLVDVSRLALPTLPTGHAKAAPVIVEQWLIRHEPEDGAQNPVAVASWAILRFSSLSQTVTMRNRLADALLVELEKLVLSGSVTKDDRGRYTPR